jgi:hypothetical protein
MKKSLNCGTPEDPRTELGAMCPRSCLGYNHCGRDVSGDSDIVDAGAYFDNDLQMTNDTVVNNDDNDDGDDDNNMDNNRSMPTGAPTFDTTNELSSNMPSYLSTELSTTSNTTTKTCFDVDGEFQTHVGPSHYRKVCLVILISVYYQKYWTI